MQQEDQNVDEYFLLDKPALKNPGWLPTDAPWPELTALRAEHLRLLRARKETREAAVELQKQYEAEDEAQAEALEASYLNGTSAPDSTGTPPEQRQAQLGAATERAIAAQSALVQYLRSAIDDIKERAPDWFADLAHQEDTLDARREDLRSQLAALESEEGERVRLGRWLDRATEQSPLGHYPYGDLPTPVPPPEPDWLSIQGGVVTNA